MEHTFGSSARTRRRKGSMRTSKHQYMLEAN
jgi:hypothetical protein